MHDSKENIYCTNCGHEITSTINYCPKCGIKISDNEAIIEQQIQNITSHLTEKSIKVGKSVFKFIANFILWFNFAGIFSNSVIIVISESNFYTMIKLFFIGAIGILIFKQYIVTRWLALITNLFIAYGFMQVIGYNDILATLYGIIFFTNTVTIILLFKLWSKQVNTHKRNGVYDELNQSYSQIEEEY